MAAESELFQDADRLARRKKAAQLLDDVLDERVSPQFAINRWPESGPLPDSSLDAAWQALWHFEADEAQQRTELFYMDAQMELLRQMANFLRQGSDLPGYLRQVYPEEHGVRFFYDRSPAADGRASLRGLWQWFAGLWRTAWRLNPWVRRKKT